MTERERVRGEHSELFQSATLTLAPGVGGFDAGMTLTKVARATGGGIALAWYETNDERADAPIATEVESAARVGVTGALLGPVHAGERFVRVQEIDAAARGVVALMESDGRACADGFVMALLGTGTAFAAVRAGKATHLGGTPLGGGSFAGITRRVDASLSYAGMIAAAERGDRRHVDTMISDIYPDGIGGVGPDLTAAHLARSRDGSLEDFLAGLLNLHGENIAQIAASRALIAGMKRVVLAGGFTHANPRLVQSIAGMAALFGVTTELAPAPGFAGAIGAALVAAETEMNPV